MGIGRAVAPAFALEGADVAIFYNENSDDAETTRAMIEQRGGRCLALRGDVRNSAECRAAVARTVASLVASISWSITPLTRKRKRSLKM